MASCQKDKAPQQGSASLDEPLTFVAGLKPTKAPIDSDANGMVTTADVTGIQILRGADGPSPMFNQLPQGALYKVPATTATLKKETNELVLADQMRYNQDGTQANFMAYYPKDATGGTYVASSTPGASATIDWTIDGNTDLIAARGVSKIFNWSGDNLVKLDFNHLLARVRFKLVCEKDLEGALYQGADYVNITVGNKVRMSVAPDGTYSIANTSNPNTPADWSKLDFGHTEISMDGEFSKNDLMIFPDVTTIKETKIAIKFSGFDYEVNPRVYTIANLRLEAGKTTVITATAKGGVEMTITNDIALWTIKTTGSDYVIE